MMRLIDADELIKHACRSTEWSHGEHPMVIETDDIDDAPTVDAEPVKHGVWFGLSAHAVEKQQSLAMTVNTVRTAVQRWWSIQKAGKETGYEAD